MRLPSVTLYLPDDIQWTAQMKQAHAILIGAAWAA
jgi:hypothetical protein